MGPQDAAGPAALPSSGVNYIGSSSMQISMRSRCTMHLSAVTLLETLHALLLFQFYSVTNSMALRLARTCKIGLATRCLPAPLSYSLDALPPSLQSG